METFEASSLDKYLTKKHIATETYESCRNIERPQETEYEESRLLGITAIMKSAIAVIDVTNSSTKFALKLNEIERRPV